MSIRKVRQLPPEEREAYLRQHLEQGRKIRQELARQWGRLPTSIWRVDWSVQAIDRSHSIQKAKKEKMEREGLPHWSGFILSGTGSRSGACSRFPQDLCQFLVKFLTPERLENDPGYFGNYLPTVLDPFAGHNSRMSGVWRCNRNYVGWDCCEEFMRMNREIVEVLERANKQALVPIEAKIELVEGDSRNIDYQEQFDFLITSPPFWDIEHYGPEKEQLGNTKSYKGFLFELERIFKRCFRALKWGSYIAVEANDFRKDKVFYPFHADMIDMLERIGFVIHDIIIADYGSAYAVAFASTIGALRAVAKQHSYFIIARKTTQYRLARERIDQGGFRQQVLEQVAKREQEEQEQEDVKQLTLFDNSLA
jgi:DNA modification methylase